MALQILFGDDEHTAKDGPYSRCLRTRKWIYVSAALAVLLAGGLYREAATTTLIKVISVPSVTFGSAVLAGLLYMLAQYGLLLRQLWVSYDLVLGERLSFRRSEELSAAAARVKASRDEILERRRSEFAELQNALAKLRAHVATAAKERDEKAIELTQLNHQSGSTIPLRREQAKERLAQLERVISSSTSEAERLEHDLRSYPARVDVSDDPAVQEAETAFEQLKAENPADRKGYRQAEILIDWLRLVPPAVFGAWAALRLSRWIWQAL